MRGAGSLGRERGPARPRETAIKSSPLPATADDDSTVAGDVADERPALPDLAAGAELVGQYQGSGYREPPHLVSRSDGQLVRLPTLLYAVVESLDRQWESDVEPGDPGQLLSAVAGDVCRETGLQLTADHVAYLLDKKLAPLGVTTYSDGAPPDLPKPTPFLALRFRTAVIGESGTWLLAGLFMWLFNPLVTVLGVAVAGYAEVWLFTTQDVGLAMQQTLRSPAAILFVILLALASSAFHEFGHATACRYGGVRPGAMGCGIYLVWPAFYTDITNSYRLDRAGRLRTDLGGVYFNAVFVIVLAALYAGTGFAPLLVAILAVNLEIIQQLLPTLRFDGYYIVSDLVGVPDLFKYIGPILKRTFLRQAPDQRLDVLKRWPQLVVSCWVTLVIPALVAQLAFVAVQVPRLLAMIWASIKDVAAAATSTAGYPVIGLVSASVQILVLLIPVVGVVLIIGMGIRGAVRMTRRRTPRYVPRHARWLTHADTA